MKTLLKKTALIWLFVLTVVCVGLFAACDNTPSNQEQPVTYTVTVENDSNAPVKDVTVYWSKGSTRYDSVKTGDDGKATMELPADTYTVTLVASTLPDGYSAPENIQVTKDKTSVTVTLVKEFRYVVNLVNEDGTPFYHENVMVAICQLEGSCLTPSPVGKDGKCFISDVEPGDYKVQISFPKDIEGQYTFEGSDVGHYYTGKNFSATDTEMTITLKAVSSQLTVTAAGTYKVTVKSAEEYATVNFQASETGVYEICSEGSLDTRVEFSPGAFFFNKTDEDDDSGEGKNFKLGGIEFQEVGPTVALRIYVKEGATFPATFNIKITRTGDAQEIVERVPQTMTPAELGEQAYGEGSGTFTAIDLSETHTFVKGADGFWHVGTVDGPVLVAKLGVSFRDEFGTITNVYGTGFYMYLADMTDETVAWDYLSFIGAYAEKCNSDGVYGVNDEIKLMLERWATNYIDEYTLGIDSLGTILEGNEWLIPCGYYTEGTTPVEKDVIVGEYTNEEYTLTVSANGTYEITSESKAGLQTIESGTWIKNSENSYTFTYVSFETGTYTVTRDENGTLTFMEDLEEPAEEPYYVFEVASSTPDPEDDVIVGEYVSEEEYILTVNANGSYTITEENMMGVNELESGTWVKNSENNYTFSFESFMPVTYTVTRDENGTLTFVDADGIMEGDIYVFEVDTNNFEEDDVIVGNYNSEKNNINVFIDGSFEIYDTEWNLVESGTWVNNDGEYQFLSYTDETLNCIYIVTLENDKLTFAKYNENDELVTVYEFTR